MKSNNSFNSDWLFRWKTREQSSGKPEKPGDSGAVEKGP